MGSPTARHEMGATNKNRNGSARPKSVVWAGTTAGQPAVNSNKLSLLYPLKRFCNVRLRRHNLGSTGAFCNQGGMLSAQGFADKNIQFSYLTEQN